MGELAASGGYMLSLGANQVFANSTSLTGSIGVVTSRPNFGNFLKQYGINNDTGTKSGLLYVFWNPLY